MLPKRACRSDGTSRVGSHFCKRMAIVAFRHEAVGGQQGLLLFGTKPRAGLVQRCNTYIYPIYLSPYIYAMNNMLLCLRAITRIYMYYCCKNCKNWSICSNARHNLKQKCISKFTRNLAYCSALSKLRIIVFTALNSPPQVQEPRDDP